MRMHLTGDANGEIGSPAADRPHHLFPGLCALPGGGLLALYTAGNGFESADQLPYYAVSQDNGRQWSTGKPLFSTINLPGGGVFSCRKPRGQTAKDVSKSGNPGVHAQNAQLPAGCGSGCATLRRNRRDDAHLTHLLRKLSCQFFSTVTIETANRAAL